MRLPADVVSSLRPAYSGLSVCVTGGCGFIGSHTVDALTSLGAKVSVIDDLSNAEPDHVLELVDLEPDRVRFIDGSVLDPRAMAEAVKGCSLVIHLAAIGSVPRSMIEPRRVFAVNAGGTVGVLEASRAAGVRRVVLASSSSIYGGVDAASPSTPRHESATPSPRSPYAGSKVAAEAALTSWCRAFGISGVSLRYFNVFGPRQSAATSYAAVVPAFTKHLLAGLPPVIFGDGRQTRDFTPVANVVLANLLAGSPALNATLDGQAINIGTGVRTSVLELATMLAERCAAAGIGPGEGGAGAGGGGGAGGGLRPRFEPSRAGDVRDSLADIALAKRVLGYAPVTDLAGGLDETIGWAKRALAGA
jgi:UDP-glucose 4-epimerase